MSRSRTANGSRALATFSNRRSSASRSPIGSSGEWDRSSPSPTSTNDATRTGAWGAGPTAVALVITGHWLIGALASQLWTIASTVDSHDINAFSIQPFINYNLADGWSITTAPIISADWTLDDDRWTLPLGLGVSKITAIGRQPMSVGIQYYANVLRTPSTGSTQLKLIASFLFPKPGK